MSKIWNYALVKLTNRETVFKQTQSGRILLASIVIFLWICSILLHTSTTLIPDLNAVHIVAILFLAELFLMGTAQRYFDPRKVYAVSLVLDMGLTFFFVSVTGGISSPFATLPLLYLMGTFLLHGMIQGIANFVISGVGYLVLYLNHPVPESANTLVTMWVLLILAAGTGLATVINEYRLNLEREALAKQARELNELKEGMTQMLVHDLKNPLTALGGYLEIMADDEREEKTSRSEWIPRIQNCLWIINQLVSNFLDISRLESPDALLSKEKFSVAPLMKEVLNESSFHAGEKNLKLTLTLSESEALTVLADRIMIRRVLSNLINNAIKFSQPGKEILIAAEKRPQEVIKISITDYGTGVPGDQQEKIFDKFWSSSSMGKGTGLGLAFCKLAIEAHGGKIWVDSRADQGTTFSFVLPTTTP